MSITSSSSLLRLAKILSTDGVEVDAGTDSSLLFLFEFSASLYDS